MDPVLLEDYTVDEQPQIIKNLLDYFEEGNFTSNENDIFVGFLYLLMLESGFITVEDRAFENDPLLDFHYQRVLALSKKLPQGWKKNNNNYNLSFILPRCPQHVCQMSCFTINFHLLISCSVKTIENAEFKLALVPNIYVPNTKCYQKLRDLSMLFKTQICYRIRCRILDLSDFRSNHICMMPYVVRTKIVSYLNDRDLMSVRLVCKHLCEVVDFKKLKENQLLKAPPKQESVDDNTVSIRQLRREQRRRLRTARELYPEFFRNFPHV